MSSVVPVPLAEEMGDARTRPGMNPCGPGRLLLFSKPYHPQLEESKPLPHILPSHGPGLRTGRCLISSKAINLILKMGKLRPSKGQSEVASLSDHCGMQSALLRAW